jgi:small subunit ribosomal protein S9
MTDAERPDDVTPDEERPQDDETAPEEPAASQEAAEVPPAPEGTAEVPAAPEEAPSTKEAEPGPEGEPAVAPPEGDRAARRPARAEDGGAAPEAIPGAHLEPDLVLEEQQETEEPDYSRYAEVEPEAELEAEAADAGEPTAATAPTEREAPAPAPRSALDLAAGARYRATGKRKTSVARVILRPGSGTYTVNGRPLGEFFPRSTLQLAARQPLQAAGYEDRMDVVARLHGGGVSSQAGALRHGIARALVEADPALRGDLKRRGFLTRDARAKERRKAGLKKARKRPQFSKR